MQYIHRLKSFKAMTSIAAISAAFALAIATSSSSTGEADYHSPYYFSCVQSPSSIISSLNVYRESSGLNGLAKNSALEDAARSKAQDMANYDYFAHDRPFNGKSDFDFMDETGVPNVWQGSNLVFLPYIDSAADTAFTLWKESPGHNANMLNRRFGKIGVGAAFDEKTETCYIAQFFSE